MTPDRAVLPGREHGTLRGATGVSTAFGTFGELLQGRLAERDGDFLVTLPVARWAVATFRADPDADDIDVVPAHKSKARRLARMVVAETGPCPVGGLLTLESSLPEGKGMASSSADLVASARAISNALDLGLSARTIEGLLGRIEPTDGVLYPGIVAYHHRSATLRRILGPLPSMAVVGLDEGGAVDTVQFNRIPKPFGAAEHREYARLLDRLADGVARRDLAAVGSVATRSAQLNQALRPKSTLDTVIDICAEVGALGVVVAHSGTMLGILIDRADPLAASKMAAAATACGELAGRVIIHTTLSFDDWGVPTDRA